VISFYVFGVTLFTQAIILTKYSNVSFIGEGLPLEGWTGGLVVAIIGAGIFNIANLLLTNYGFQKVEAIFASSILALESAFAIVLGLLFYAEVPALRELLGGVIITLSVIGTNWVEEKE